MDPSGDGLVHSSHLIRICSKSRCNNVTNRHAFHEDLVPVTGKGPYFS